MALSRWCVALSAALALSACDPGSDADPAEETDASAVEPSDDAAPEQRDAEAGEELDADARVERDADAQDASPPLDGTLDVNPTQDAGVDAGDALAVATEASQPQPDAAEASVDASEAGTQPAQCSTSCSGHGSCSASSGAPVCSCDVGYGGSDCANCATGYARRPGDARCVLPAQINEVRASAPTASCVPGGRILLEGVDNDFSGTLDEGEITKQTTICAVVRSGDVLITNAAELESLRGVTDVTGNLTIKAPFIGSLEPLRALVSVGKNLIIEGSNTLVDLKGLGWLDQVGGSFTLRNNAALANAEGLTALRSVTGDVTVESNPALSVLALGPLQVVQGSVNVSNNAQLTRIDGSRLRSVVGSVQLLNHPKLESLGAFTGLGAIGGSLSITNCDALVHLRDLGALRDVASLVLRGNAKLTDLAAFAGLKTVRGNLQLVSLPALRTLFGPAQLISVAGHLAFYDLPLLKRIDGLDQLVSVGAGLLVSDNAALEEIAPFALLSSLGGSWPTVVSAVCKEDRVEPSPWFPGVPFPPDSGCSALLDSIRLEGNAALRRFGGAPQLVLKGQRKEIYFSKNAQLSQLENLSLDAFAAGIHLDDLPALREWPATLATLQSFTGLSVSATGLLQLSLPKYAGGDGTRVSISGNAALQTLEFAAAGAITALDVRGNAALQRIALGVVTRLDNLYVNKNPLLRELQLGELRSAGSLDVSENAELVTVRWPKLEALSWLYLVDNDAMVSPPDWALTSTNQSFFPNVTIRGNARLKSLPQFEAAPARLDVIDNDALTTLQALHFTNVSGILQLEGNDALTSLSSARTTAVSQLYIVGNAELVNVGPTGLKALDRLEVRDNPRLTSVSGLSIPFGQTLLQNNDALTNLDGVINRDQAVSTLYVEGNDALVSVAGLAPILAVYQTLDISNNVKLPQCAVQSFFNKLTGPGTRSGWGNNTTATCP